MLDDTAICYPAAAAEYDHIAEVVSGLVGAPRAAPRRSTPAAAVADDATPPCADTRHPVTPRVPDAAPDRYESAAGVDCFMFR